jgi:hypothetical protein
MKRLILSTFAAGALLVVPVAQMIASQLGAKVTALAIMKGLADSGWVIRDGAIDELGQGESKVYPVTLYYGNTYKIVAAGDEDAADVDIGVYYGPEGKFLVKDDDDSNVAVVTVTPAYTDQFYIKVVMATTKTGGSAHYVVQYASKTKSN